jgi:pyruvate/2-oxoglutarate dehydrogenase complex dihydrolipoamide acyltransferase (E2) component
MEIRIPRLGQAMQEGTIVEWHADDGDAVVAGQLLYLLETDKVESEIEAPVGGTLRVVEETGQALAVGTVIAYIDEP